MKKTWLWLAVMAGLVLTMLFVAGCTNDDAAVPPDHSGHSGQHSDAGSTAAAPATAVASAAATAAQTKCPVMGNPVNRDIYVDYQGRRIYFCCQMCPDKFKADPDKYLAVLDGQSAPASGMAGCDMANPTACAAGSRHACESGAPAAGTTAPAAKYTCPMHPEIVADAPGRCPKCGMNLVPKQ